MSRKGRTGTLVGYGSVNGVTVSQCSKRRIIKIFGRVMNGVDKGNDDVWHEICERDKVCARAFESTQI